MSHPLSAGNSGAGSPTVPQTASTVTASASGTVTPSIAAGSQPCSQAGKPKRISRWSPERLAERRRLMAKIKSETRREVAEWISYAQDTTYQVSLLSIAATGHLTAAAALQMISHYCEQSLQNGGDQFVYRPTQKWLDCTGLSNDEWIHARQLLRDAGFIAERRRFDLALQEIVIEIAFDFYAWADKVEELRQRKGQQIQAELEIEAGVIQTHLAPVQA